ncbi:HAMP domain-containing histidine kinase [Poseidonibacter lekithochrous]|uniref:sensor histidine kinase n=1 Tax=Poseidonibacter TaxID=2321187 RepID=UPI001C08AE56|nr:MULTISPECIES: HAMP domain-containing sensor histidine kinase [Poseidonibacter]MBU3013124.1 HAMP domain-containing histidine kinase [Poseidonibacter lekithochrous]MDO6826420.1 HAMP domain-containing sensor histidine kinase [Poseidonibacter sp. 1_MG-2023]
MKLTFKITATVLITVISLLIFFGFFIIKDEKKFLETLQNRQGKTIVNIISISILDSVLLSDYAAIDTIVENISQAYKNIISIQVSMNDKVVSQAFKEEMSKDEKSSFKSNVVIDDVVLAKVVITVSNLEDSKLIDKRVEYMIFISSLITCLLIFILILIIKYLLINKINFISKSTKQIKLNNLHKHIEINTNDEFKDLANNINEMTKQLDKEIQENRSKTKLLSEQSKMASLGEMLGNIAHQWRQPLSVISSAATGSKLQKEMEMLEDKDFYRAMDSINNSAQYLSQTIEDFRGFFNPNNIKIREIEISKTIKKVLNIVNSQFAAKNIKIIKNINNITLKSIENELIQVLINILNNSKDALLDKEAENKLIFIKTYKKDDILCIEVLDNAGGIKDDVIDKVFEPYFTTKHQAKGTGIGLYMSHDIVINHLKGNITVSNENFIYEDVNYIGAKFTIEINL